jgi:hypothetical protein
MRGHLEQAIEDRLRDGPLDDVRAVTLEETRAFGDPAEIGAAHKASFTRDPPARPRFPIAPRWLALGGAALVVALVVIAIGLWGSGPTGIAPYARANEGLVNHSGLVNETFDVPPGALDLTILVDVAHDVAAPAGCAGVRITTPSGAVALDEWDACGDMTHALRFRPDEQGETGRWRVEIRYRGFTGDLAISSEAHLS